MTGPVSTQIDGEKCIGCGLCLAVCPDRTIALQGGVATVNGTECISCGHCQAVCPVGAISVPEIGAFLHLATIHEDLHWLPHGDYDPASLVRLMRSRRSCRNYTDKPVSGEMLKDLVKIGTTAPSGTNSQGWTFTIIDRRQDVIKLGKLVALFFKKLNRMAENPLLRLAARLFGGDRLGSYYRKYYRTVAHGLREWEEQGVDRLFHGAVAVIMVGGTENASCPAEDAMLATQNMLLAAHAMGLGTCLIGFAVEAVKNDPAIKKQLSIPAAETVHAVIALGHPAERYREVCGRKEVVPRYARL
ncbi:MAG: nitroreductase family protein [Deltaproteobacteria bacterium]|nr:nitroreductase family protein [Deltaproteobacteria bacterium]